jgi:hypothetical protein
VGSQAGSEGNVTFAKSAKLAKSSNWGGIAPLEADACGVGAIDVVGEADDGAAFLGEVKLRRVTLVADVPLAVVETVAMLKAVDARNPPAGVLEESNPPSLSLAQAMASIEESLLALLNERMSETPAPEPPRAARFDGRSSRSLVVMDMPSSSVGRLGKTDVDSPSVLYWPLYVLVSMGGSTPRLLRFS